MDFNKKREEIERNLLELYEREKAVDYNFETNIKEFFYATQNYPEGAQFVGIARRLMQVLENGIPYDLLGAHAIKETKRQNDGHRNLANGVGVIEAEMDIINHFGNPNTVGFFEYVRMLNGEQKEVSYSSEDKGFSTLLSLPVNYQGYEPHLAAYIRKKSCAVGVKENECGEHLGYFIEALRKLKWFNTMEWPLLTSEVNKWLGKNLTVGTLRKNCNRRSTETYQTEIKSTLEELKNSN